MKKPFITTMLMGIMAANMAFAQTNLNFESWTGNEPNGWTSSNAITQTGGGAQTLFKETTNAGQGSSSVRMVTGNCPDCPNFSILGPFGPATPLPNPLGGSIELGTFAGDGVPYTSRPISVDFKYKANPQGNDAGAFWLELTRYNPSSGENDVVGEAYFEVNAKVNTWTNVNIPVVYYSNLMPDTINISATSSVGSIPDLSAFGVPSPIGLPTPVAGSEFFLDAIVLNLPSCAGFSLAISGTKESSLGANDGTATATPSGGTPPYSYAWSNLATTQSISGLIPGYYSVTVTDANQCQKVKTYYVAPGTCSVSVGVSGTNSSTNSIYTGNGSVTATVSGGNPPYNYQWNTGATTATINNLAIGTYAVLVTEQNNPNCAVWGYYTVYGPGGTVGIDEEHAETKVSVAPNPMAAQTILTTDDILKNATLSITNVLGQEVKQMQNLSGQEVAISRDNLVNGVYFLRLTEGKKVVATQKLVIAD